MSKDHDTDTERQSAVKERESLEKLRALLKTLFELDMPELDFGIYRIMNYRRKEVEEFIEEDLLRVVEKEFERYRAQSRGELVEKIEKKREEIKRLETQLGEKILRNGDIEEKFRDKPLAREYLELRKQLDELEVTESVKNQVFNDLYNFFSRYYEDGDFISKRRISSRQHRYAIPYDGEETKLYWANFDQYYVKTGEVFKDYEFKSNGWRIIFRTIIAETDVGNVKGERRYFVLHPQRPVEIDKKTKTCTIFFEFRQLTDEDFRRLGVKVKSGEEKETGIGQEELNSLIEKEVLRRVSDKDLNSLLSAKENEKTVFEKHLHRYTRRITSDFFVHKNLKAFLERELDNFIKAEVIDLNNLEPRHITRAKVVEGIGKKIIEFLSQIEEFQKRLWEKKKFVIKTDYVITTDLIPHEFHEEILSNKEQLKEWEELGFGNVKKGDLTHKNLPVDTKHFSDHFKEMLLERLAERGSLDELIDGVLIKSDNFQALKLLEEKYKEKIKCIYIDPPYNTGSDEFIYKDKYQHSCWLSLMFDRVLLARKLMRNDGVFFVSIDDNEFHNLKQLLDIIFGEVMEVFKIKVRHEQRILRGDVPFQKVIEYVLLCRKTPSYQPPKLQEGEDLSEYIYKIEEESPPIKVERIGEYEVHVFKPNQYRIITLQPSKQNLKRYTIRGSLITQRGSASEFYELYLRQRKEKDGIGALYKVMGMGIKGDGLGYRYIQQPTSWKFKNGIYFQGYPLQVKGEKPYPNFWDFVEEFNVVAEEGGIPFKHGKKPIKFLQRLISIGEANEQTPIILDFFAGSGSTGHAVIDLNSKDNKRRKVILVEIGNWFDTALLPRMKKVVFCLRWKDNKPAGETGTTCVLKYHVLEQYEDALHNIEFPSEKKGRRAAKLFRGGEYMKHFLQYETKGSSSLLDINQFENPFEYKLKVISGGRGEEIANVDLVETFNYLIGLKVNKYKFLKENGRKYVFVFGEKENKRVAVVWRPTKAIDLKKDKQIIDETITGFCPDEVYINGNALIENYKVIETEFKVQMGV